MCLMFVKLDDQETFGRWAVTARTAAAQAGDAATLSWVLAQEGYGRYYGGDLRGAVDVARHAQGLMRGIPGVGAVLAAALEARAYAACGDGEETRRALGWAEVILGALEAWIGQCACFWVHRVAAPVPRRERLHPAAGDPPSIASAGSCAGIVPAW
jgi:hypothetical protein